MLKIIAFTLMLACFTNAQQFPINAAASIGGGILGSNGRDPIMIFGDVKFTQQSSVSPVVVSVNVTFFPPNDPLVNRPRGFHIHTFGIASVGSNPAETCESAGPHWNPLNTRHGGLNDLTSHEGDLGNVAVSPVNGQIVTQIVSSKLKLFGIESIIGRSVVLHEKFDDQGTGQTPLSEKTGNAGAKIACGTIGVRP